MQKKYLVYIGSCGDDVKTERRELVKIVTEIGALPVTMDAFDINEKKELPLIKQTIEECDYFLVLTAHKHGGFEAEYSHAVKNGVPVIALIIDEKARWKASKKEKDAKLVKSLAAFKQKLTGHAFETWTNIADLRQKAQSLLIQELHLNPREGWMPAGRMVDPAVANELAKLIKENEELRQHLKLEGGGLLARVREQMKKTLKVLAVNKISLSFYYAPGENWENTREFRYLKLFKLLTPELSLPKTTAELSYFLGNILNPDLDRTVRKEYPTPTNTIKKIMADFSLLKLIRSAEGKEEAWEITEFGKEAYAAYRLRQLERGLTKHSAAPTEV